MKKKILTACITGLSLVGMVSAANAYTSLFDGVAGYSIVDLSSVEDHPDGPNNPDGTYYGYTGSDYTGWYIGTVAGADPTMGVMEDLVKAYMGDTTYQITQSATDVPGVADGDNLNVTYNGNLLGGFWNYTDSNVNFYTVKGENFFSLYFVDPARNMGIFTTRHLLGLGGDGQPQVSQFSVSLAESTAPVPEPATMLLLGTGLLGIVGVTRKRKKA